MIQTIARSALVLLAAATLLVAFAFYSARSTPIVRTATIYVTKWPRGTPPVRIALLADIHIGNATMNEARLGSIVDQVNALAPDLVVIAGDFLAGYDKVAAPERTTQAARQLARLRSPMGAVAVLGNHDYATASELIATTLERVGITVLMNDAVKRGPLIIGGLGDGYSGHARAGPMLSAMSRLSGIPLVVMHSPNDAGRIPASLPLILAGHTHCGQIVLPVVGALSSGSTPPGLLCGLVRQGQRITIVTAGLGTSTFPLQLGAPPDIWMITLKANGSR